MRFSQLAPTGTAIPLHELLTWAFRLGDSRRTLDQFSAALQQRYGIHECLFVSSGRAAMFLLLRALQRAAGDDRRRDVIIPSYTCYSVAASAIRAGLRVRVCDINPRTLSYDLDALGAMDFTQVLAIVSANLYGLPNDLPAIENIARRNNVFMIDDAAQCMHGTIADRPVGTFGDVGLYSLDKGKNITSLQGGILAVHSLALAQALHQELASVPEAAAGRTLKEMVQLVIYALFLRPSLYRLPASLPFLGLGRTVYTTEYPAERYSPWLASIAYTQFRRIDEITAARRRVAERFADALSGASSIRVPTPLPNSRPAWLRFPVLARSPAHRDRLLALLSAQRLGASLSYPLSIVDVAGIQPHLSSLSARGDGGREIAGTLFTLPTHAYVSDRHITDIASVIRSVDTTG